ncbi:MAG: helix-turn-helix transcriptional regulator [Verrucomicrobia bacterium]|jgi:transcriptional regulator with XRE-family HTH domain|nr:helix-turn-helix transcriptional regulator [Verrucomicrobiota bacterium]
MKREIPKHRTRFGDAIRDRRTVLGLSQEQLAEGVGCHRNYMGRIERGEQNITLDMMTRVAKALKCSIKELMHESRL